MLTSAVPSVWNRDDYIHQRDIDDTWPDSEIWAYAKQHDLTIISKDADFSERILFSKPPPKVIHIRIGNLRLKDFRQAIENCWEAVVAMSQTHKLVNVYLDRIEGVN